jgi:hypothetical protein
MILNWQGNNAPIKSNRGGQPLTSHGPALVASGTLLDMIYVGDSGTNLWNNSTLAAIFPEWDSNAKIDSSVTASGSVPLSTFRPALALFNNLIHMAYVGKEHENLWWAWCEPNGKWNNLQLPWSGALNPAPALAVHDDGNLYLAWHEYEAAKPATYDNYGNLISGAEPEHNYIRFSSLNLREPLEVASWTAPQLLADGGVLPALCSFQGRLHLVVSPAAPNPLTQQILMSSFDGTSWSALTPFAITGSNPLSSGGVAMAVFNSELYLVYPGAGGKDIWYSWIDAQGQPHGNVQILAGSTPPKTSAPLGVTAFNGALCVAYKGESSNNFWVSYGRP